jgi:hypothetical protein
MDGWARVKWSRADQAVDADFLEEAAAAGGPTAASAPRAYFAALRAAGQNELAARFLGQALPRLEAVAWAARAVRDLAAPGPGVDADALKAALLWVQDPSETRRRAAAAAAERCDPAAAARMAALAAFYAGGSVAPPDCDPLPAPRDAAGRFAAGAVMLACAGQDDMDAALQNCLAAGEQLADAGLDEGTGP